MASSPELVEKFERKIPRVSAFCCCLDMTAGGTVLSVFGILTGFAYIARAFMVLYNVAHFEKQQQDDDALNNNDDAIHLVYISTLFCGFFFLITSGFMLYGSTKYQNRKILGFKRMSHHVFPYLLGILFSVFWSIVLGFIEVFDSDMLIALGYFAFAGLQIYFWICAASLYRDLLDAEKSANKPTRTQV